MQISNKLALITLSMLARCLCSSEPIKVVVLNDLHLDPYFDLTESVQEDCRGPTPFHLTGIKNTDYAPFGRYG